VFGKSRYPAVLANGFPVAANLQPGLLAIRIGVYAIAGLLELLFV
jgi:hypothetical protein